jgi:hypothetical protein
VSKIDPNFIDLLQQENFKAAQQMIDEARIKAKNQINPFGQNAASDQKHK